MAHLPAVDGDDRPVVEGLDRGAERHGNRIASLGAYRIGRGGELRGAHLWQGSKGYRLRFDTSLYLHYA